MARLLTDAGFECLVIDKREHVAGNCYTEKQDGIIVHKYGPHYFHTNDVRVWAFVQRFCHWKPYVPRVKAHTGGRVFSFPINLLTLEQLWGVSTPSSAEAALLERRRDVPGDHAEAFLLRTVGQELYERFFYGYTCKQWGREPRDLPSAVVSRVPFRLNYDDSYHRALYQALPAGGYTGLVESMLDGIHVELGTDFFDLKSVAPKERTIYTGPIDALYAYDLGHLEYRSLRFEQQMLPVADYQGCAQMNYPDHDIPYTRIVEHKHLHDHSASNLTIITKEYPCSSGDPYYPVPTQVNRDLASRYMHRARADGYFIGGRLGTYRYMDMDGAIASAMRLVDHIL